MVKNKNQREKKKSKANREHDDLDLPSPSASGEDRVKNKRPLRSHFSDAKKSDHLAENIIKKHFDDNNSRGKKKDKMVGRQMKSIYHLGSVF